jgi:SPP1 gp7 family putative phage head morphogenesis protein
VSWGPSKRAEQEYEQALLSALKYVESKTSSATVNVIGRAKALALYAQQAATRMITGLYFKGARSWREAARRSSRSDILYRALQAEMNGTVGRRVRQLIRENAKLISSFPQVVARRAVTLAQRTQAAGGRSKGLGEVFSGVARSRARTIARTEVSKASTALTRARSEEMGLEWYVWESSQDERTRRSHRKMQGVLCRFDDPPDPEVLVGEKSQGHYNAGDIYNCRCYPAPLVSEREVSWPHPAYYNGRIQYLTLSQFRFINQGERKAA